MLKEAKRIFRETTGRDPKQFRGRVTQIKKDLLAQRDLKSEQEKGAS